MREMILSSVKFISEMFKPVLWNLSSNIQIDCCDLFTASASVRPRALEDILGVDSYKGGVTFL